jgi:hypothetical protein
MLREILLCSITWIRRVGKIDDFFTISKALRTNPLRDDFESSFSGRNDIAKRLYDHRLLDVQVTMR